MRDDRLAYLLMACTLAACVERVLTPGHALSWLGAAEALAHILVGVLITLALVRRGSGVGRLSAALLLIASAVETCMFLWGPKL